MTTEATAGRGLREILSGNFVFLQKWVHQASGIMLDDGKKYLVDARLSPILREGGLDSLDDLCNLLRAARGAGLDWKVVDAMTTGARELENRHLRNRYFRAGARARAGRKISSD
jgi:chemotaxis methyl-accepting protein methylase